jgi:small subunit ribosomal protein S6
MPEYDVGLIIRAEGGDEQMQQQLIAAEEIITKDGGAIQQKDAWGRRRLAYPIQKHREGVYHFLKVAADPTCVERWRRSYRLADSILRVLILRADELEQTPPAAAITATADVSSEATQPQGA